MDFALFLNRRGVISPQQFVDAAAWVQESRTPMGELAIRLRKLTIRQVMNVLCQQAVRPEQFGKLAVAAGYMSVADLNELLASQTEQAMSMDDALVELGMLTQSERDRYYSEFLRIRSDMLQGTAEPQGDSVSTPTGQFVTA
jgi:hypothetical protein